MELNFGAGTFSALEVQNDIAQHWRVKKVFETALDPWIFGETDPLLWGVLDVHLHRPGDNHLELGLSLQDHEPQKIWIHVYEATEFMFLGIKYSFRIYC